MLQVISKYGEMSGKGALTITTINGADKVFPPAAPVWGSITGTLSAQTDLQSALNSKQDILVSAVNIKTINSNSILGSGDLAITASATWGSITGMLSSQTDLQTALNAKVNLAGDSMLGFLTLNADPTSALHAATKQYVDNFTAGINFHAPCHVATTGNLSATYSNGVSGVGATLTSTVNGVLSIDSHSPIVTDRVLVWQQTAGLQNGIYVVTDIGSVSTPWILTRATDADNSPAGELANGDFTFIQQGATYGGFGFILNTTGTITVGVTAINYVQFNAAQVVTAGYGLQELTPNVFSVDTSVIATVASLGSYLTSASAAATYYPLTNPSNYITSATAASTYEPIITAGTISQYWRGDKTWQTLDKTAVGLSNVVNLDTSTTANITDFTNKRFVTDPEKTVIAATSGTNTGDETNSSIKTKLGASSASNDGYLSSADWSTFNGKQSALGFTAVPTTRTISTTSPLSGGGDLSANRTLTIADALADGSTKGAAAFNGSDFNATSGVISIDYTSGQSASASNKGFLTSADWSTFNSKEPAITNGFGLTGTTTKAVALTSAEAFCTAETTLSATTYADITGASITLAAGTWMILATINGSCQTTTAAILYAAITDSANTIIAEGAQHIVAGTATVRTWGNVTLSAIVTPSVSTIYKLRGARGQTTSTSNVIVSDGTGQGTANNTSNNSDKSTSIRAIRIA